MVKLKPMTTIMMVMIMVMIGGARAQQTISFQLAFNGGPQCSTATCTTTEEEYIPYYACSDGTGDWNGGNIDFWDPIPPNNGYVLTNAVATALARCWNSTVGVCAFSTQYSSPLAVTLVSGTTLGANGLSPTNSTCPNCMSVIQFDSLMTHPNGWPNYLYGQNNTFQFMTLSSDTNIYMCVSEVNVTFTFGPTQYAVTDLSPKRGPHGGGTAVTVYGVDFDSAKVPSCSYVPSLNLESHIVRNVTIVSRFGGLIVEGTYVNDSIIECVAPPFDCPNEIYPCNVTVEIAQQSWGFTFNGVNFTYYKVTPPSKGKSPPLLWVYVAVGVCAGSVILVVAAGYIYAKRSTNNSARFVDEQSRLINSEKFKRYGSLHPIDISEIMISQRIGRGSCAEVYMGLWRGTTVAIKKAKVFADDDEEFFTELAQEAEIMSALRHPNVLQFLGTASSPPELVIVMEFMSRGSLYRIIHDKAVELPWLRIKHMALDVARGMNYLHCSDPIIIHRDLKSHNLLVDEHFKVKVCDFGLSTMVKRHLDKFTAMTPVGTPCWTAPEVLRNEPYSEKADVFSFGVVMWELITREDPYHGMPTFQIVIAVGQHNMRPIIPASASPTLTALITQCWSEDPAQRPSFADIVTRLEKM